MFLTGILSLKNNSQVIKKVLFSRIIVKIN